MIDLIILITVVLGCGVVARVIAVRWLLFWLYLVLYGVFLVLIGVYYV